MRTGAFTSHQLSLGQCLHCREPQGVQPSHCISSLLLISVQLKEVVTWAGCLGERSLVSSVVGSDPDTVFLAGMRNV